MNFWTARDEELFPWGGSYVHADIGQALLATPPLNAFLPLVRWRRSVEAVVGASFTPHHTGSLNLQTLSLNVKFMPVHHDNNDRVQSPSFGQFSQSDVLISGPWGLNSIYRICCSRTNRVCPEKSRMHLHHVLGGRSTRYV